MLITGTKGHPFFFFFDAKPQKKKNKEQNKREKIANIRTHDTQFEFDTNEHHQKRSASNNTCFSIESLNIKLLGSRVHTLHKAVVLRVLPGDVL